jgi:hypothetical protein
MDQAPKAPGHKLPSSPGAARVRAHRKRRRQGLQSIPVAVHVSEIDALIAKGLLTERDRHDRMALQTALTHVLYKFLDE